MVLFGEKRISDMKKRDGKHSKTQSENQVNMLVSAVKSNDTASFLELLGIYSHTIVALARSFSLPASELEDLCQEGRMALYRAAMSYDEKTAKFSTYAITCMTNAMISLAKKYNSAGSASLYDVSPEEYESGRNVMGDAHNGGVSALEIEELLSENSSVGFSGYERRVMSLKLSGYKVSEIAKIVGKEAKSIENTLFRARKKLKEHLNG